MSTRRLLKVLLLGSLVLSLAPRVEAQELRRFCYECSTCENAAGVMVPCCKSEVPGETGRSLCSVTTYHPANGIPFTRCLLDGIPCTQSHYPGDSDGCQRPDPNLPPWEAIVEPGETQLTPNGEPAAANE